MKYLLFCVLSYATAYPDIQQLLSGSLIHLGSYDALVKIGNLSKPYEFLDDRDLLAIRSAKQFIQEARGMFNVGNYNLPPLDPYVRPHLPVLNVNGTGTIKLNNLKMTGAQRFNLEFLEIRLKTGRVDLEFSVPKINIEVDVSADVVIIGILPIHFNGHLSLVLKNVSILEGLQAEQGVHNEDVHYQLVAQHSRLRAGDVMLKFTNIKLYDILKYAALGSSNLSFSNILGNLKKHIDKYIASFVLQQINSILLGPTVNQILTYLLPKVSAK